MYRLHRLLLTTLAPLPIMQPPLFYVARLCLVSAAARRLKSYFPHPPTDTLTATEKLKWQLKWSGKCHGSSRRAEECGRWSLYVGRVHSRWDFLLAQWFLSRKKASVSTDQKTKSVWQGLHSMAKTGAGVTWAPIIFNQAPLSSWHGHFATERKILVFYGKNGRKGKIILFYVSMCGSIKTEFE